MSEIKCPNCNSEFHIDESGYIKIVQQIRDLEFEKAVAIRKAELDGMHEVELLRLQQQFAEKEEMYKALLVEKEKEVELYRDFKIRLSTKGIGESLEKYCEDEFNKIRATAFPNVYFEKDNDAKSGSKGDYIYREEIDGVELISIMFEMKNEMDSTAEKQKHTIESFLKKLDKDRTEKKCEYAVLVSLLEKDSNLYNQGIVDMSHKYPKMYAIRPQLFIPMITVLRNAALKSLEYKKRVAELEQQQADVSQFEANLEGFVSKINDDYRLADENFANAIKNIEDSIAILEKTKEYLLKTGDKLRLADKKAQSITIRKLVKNAPSVKQMFDELK